MQVDWKELMLGHVFQNGFVNVLSAYRSRFDVQRVMANCYRSLCMQSVGGLFLAVNRRRDAFFHGLARTAVCFTLRDKLAVDRVAVPRADLLF